MMIRNKPHMILRAAVIILIILYAISYAAQFHQFVKLHQLNTLHTHPLEDSALQQQQSENAKKVHREDTDTTTITTSSSSSKDVHIVFSTDCSGYQHYQSILSYYSIRRSGHSGPTTRVVSGCNPKEQSAIETEFSKIDSTQTKLRLHFSPSFALPGKHYKYSNKPGGLYHWMNETDIKEEVIALIDPDMILLRPITPTLGQGLVESSIKGGKLLQYTDEERGGVQLLRQTNLPQLPQMITKGIAAGQHFGLGGMWASSGMKNAQRDFREFNLTKVCGNKSPCLNEIYNHDKSIHITTRQEADQNYAVGPVYIATTSDWKDLLPKWHEATPRVHDQYPKLLAEMFGFTMSAADIQLHFALSSSYMVSDPHTMSTTESWAWIDNYGEWIDNSVNVHDSLSTRSVCEGAKSNVLPKETLKRLQNYGYGHYNKNDMKIPISNAGPLPTTLHYCQRYLFANHTFAKRKIPHDFFKCEGEPLNFDIYGILKELNSLENDSALSDSQKKVQRRTAYMICHIIPLMNIALEEYKIDMNC